MDNFEGVQGVWLRELVALSDLEKEENTEVGRRQLTSPIVQYHVPGINYRCDGFVENP